MDNHITDQQRQQVRRKRKKDRNKKDTTREAIQVRQQQRKQDRHQRRQDFEDQFVKVQTVNDVCNIFNKYYNVNDFSREQLLTEKKIISKLLDTNIVKHLDLVLIIPDLKFSKDKNTYIKWHNNSLICALSNKTNTRPEPFISSYYYKFVARELCKMHGSVIKHFKVYLVNGQYVKEVSDNFKYLKREPIYIQSVSLLIVDFCCFNASLKIYVSDEDQLFILNYKAWYLDNVVGQYYNDNKLNKKCRISEVEFKFYCFIYYQLLVHDRLYNGADDMFSYTNCSGEQVRIQPTLTTWQRSLVIDYQLLQHLVIASGLYDEDFGFYKFVPYKLKDATGSEHFLFKHSKLSLNMSLVTVNGKLAMGNELLQAVLNANTLLKDILTEAEVIDYPHGLLDYAILLSLELESKLDFRAYSVIEKGGYTRVHVNKVDQLFAGDGIEFEVENGISQITNYHTPIGVVAEEGGA